MCSPPGCCRGGGDAACWPCILGANRLEREREREKKNNNNAICGCGARRLGLAPPGCKRRGAAPRAILRGGALQKPARQRNASGRDAPWLCAPPGISPPPPPPLYWGPRLRAPLAPFVPSVLVLKKSRGKATPGHADNFQHFPVPLKIEQQGLPQACAWGSRGNKK